MQPRRRSTFLPRLLPACVAAAWWAVAISAFAAESKPPSPTPGPLVIDDRPEPLVPRQPRTEEEEDRVKAMALFATARTYDERQEDEKALRYYGRALRYDPKSRAIVEALLELAVRSKGLAAVQYASRVLAVEGIDPALLRQLAVRLTEAGDFSQAATCYEKAVAALAERKQPEDFSDVFFRMEMGRLYHLVEDYKKGADQFARVVHALNHPDEFPGLDEKRRTALLGEAGPTYELMGECFLLADRLDEATAAFKKARELTGKEPLLWLNLARVAERAGKADEALAGLERYFGKHLSSEGLLPYQLLADVLKKLGRRQELVGRLEKLYAVDAANAPLGYFLAGQYVETANLDKAERLYTALMKKTPTGKAYRALADMYLKQKRADDLLTVLGAAVEKAASIDLFNKDGKSLLDDPRLLQSLVDASRQRLASDAKKLDYGMRLAVALVALEGKKYDTATEFFELALAAGGPRPAEVYLIWGVGLLLDDRAAEAIQVLQRAVDAKVLGDDNQAFYFYLAGALALGNRTEEALAAARKAVQGRHASVRFASRVPWILYHAKRNDEAMKAYAELVAKHDKDTSPEIRDSLRDVRLALSGLCVLAERMPEAEEWLEQVLDEFPDDIGAFNDLGYLWADQGKRLQRALAMIRKAVEAEPENAAYRDSLGWVYYRLGRFPEAVAELEKAAAGKQTDAVVLDHLGDALLKAGQPERAKDAWRRALEGFRKEKDEKKVKQTEEKLKK